MLQRRRCESRVAEEQLHHVDMAARGCRAQEPIKVLVQPRVLQQHGDSADVAAMHRP